MRELAHKTDTKLNKLYGERFVEQGNLERAKDYLRYLHDARYDYTTKTYKRPWSDVLAERSKTENGSYSKRWVDYDRAIEAIKAIDSQIDPLEELYREHRWSRFYLVPAGHIHRNTNCHSCYETTQYAWLPELSGLTDADAVQAEGEILCTFCFPDAPVAWTEGVGRRTLEQREEAQKAKEERMRAKAEKSLSLDGTVVKIVAPDDGYRRWSRWKEFKTYRSAELWLVEALAHRTLKALIPAGGVVPHAPDAYSEENLEAVLDMMAVKKNLTKQEILDAMKKRVSKKVEAEREWLRI